MYNIKYMGLLSAGTLETEVYTNNPSTFEALQI